MSAVYSIRDAGEEDDPVLASHFRQMWLDAEIPESALVPDWCDRTLAFLSAGRASQEALGVVAEAKGTPVGSLIAQRYGDLYPEVLSHDHRRYAYVWGVYVRPPWRRRGMARAMMEYVVGAFRRRGYSLCTCMPRRWAARSMLVSSFVPTNEMRLELQS